MFLKLLSTVLLISSASYADINWARQESKGFQHQLKKEETLWFLAQVYYGNGNEYSKILSASGISSLDKVKKGALLTIPQPKYSPSDSNFKQRYAAVMKKRNYLLSLKMNQNEILENNNRSPASTKEETTVPAEYSPRYLAI